MHRKPWFLISSLRFLPLGVAACLSTLSAVHPVEASDALVLPVPTTTIYPGDTIKEAWIIEREFAANSTYARGNVLTERAALVGKAARRTLLPGVPIPINALSEPKAVLNGAKVRIVFMESGLTITAFGSALQSGSVGDNVSVRNLDSGLTVSGIVQADGSIRVSGS
ncbi:Flagellar basal body P-ring biosynthesis protein-like protein [Beijerinckia indica subsp. indica ATCC 9039]|uniref:Flagella basal body P-ring formation protein FlgA n=1 Tax=Beijerinckia indica subsp. indica (strain ATCC 9039 / DSM 1715 / NCIMB 8712) TaxID=395963 RepID=B2IGV8_BEII9|nr:Flagellar basal body P-ring biosynthesis protein-like protein [Beijerinckia indica subsp. indica ATCC 9039]